MDPDTREQLLLLSAEFYEAHAEGFDASRGHQPWPGWPRWAAHLSAEDANTPLRVLDVGCGNARLAPFLASAVARPLDYIGLDGNAGLLAAARERLPEALREGIELIEADFLAPPAPGAHLPAGPFDVVALFGVLHHVPGQDWRRALIAAAAQRVAPGGLLVLAAWQFAGRERFKKRTVAWSDLEALSGRTIDPAELETGDTLLRFGADPEKPPRYCHQVSDAEFESIPAALAEDGLACRPIEDYRADGGEGDLNRYLVLERETES